MTQKTKPDLAMIKLETLCCLLIVLLGIIIFGNHLKNSFQFDSVAYVVNNQNLKNPEEMLTLDYWERGLFSRSLVQMSLAMNATKGQMQPFGYHLFNLTLHIFNALLIFFVTRKICLDLSPEFKPLGRDPVWMLSLFTALLFLCHPLQTESVVYIMSRSEVLSATFYLGGFYLFQTCVESGRKISPALKYAGILPLLGMIFLTGFSVKQTLITLPAVLLLYSLCRADAQSRPIKFLKRWRWVLTGVIFLVGIILLRKLLEDETLLIGPSNPDEMVGRKSYLLSQPSVLIFYYLKLLLFPFNLNIDPDLPVVTELFSSRFLVPLVGIGTMLYLTVRAKKTRIYFFCVAWFFILISPSSSIVTLHDLAAEHRTYLAAYGFYLLFVLSVFQLRVKKKRGVFCPGFSDLFAWTDDGQKEPRVEKRADLVGRHSKKIASNCAPVDQSRAGLWRNRGNEASDLLLRKIPGIGARSFCLQLQPGRSLSDEGAGGCGPETVSSRRKNRPPRSRGAGKTRRDISGQKTIRACLELF